MRHCNYMDGVLRLGRAIGWYLGVPHRLANAVVLPLVMESGYLACPERFRDVAVGVGEETSSLNVYEEAYRAVEAVRKLMKDIGVPFAHEFGAIDKGVLRCWPTTA